MEICMDCSIFLYQIKVFIQKAQSAAELIRNSKIDEPQTQEKFIDKSSLKIVEEINYEEDVYEEETSTIEDTATVEDIQSFEKYEKKNGEKVLISEDDEDEKLFTFACHVCDEPEFTKMFQLSAHTRSAHSCLPQVKCYCDKLLSTMRGLQRHRAKHFPRSSDIRCTQCTRVFKTQKGLNNHFEKSHGPNKAKFICASCGQNFCNEKVLQRHELTHELPPELRRNYECSECNKKFISSDARKGHIAKYHEKVLSFFCDVCSKGFYTRKSLLSHSETHKPHESVACDLCNRTFKAFKNMHKHRKTHFAPALEEYLVCDNCEKQFRKKSQLKLHMLTHSEVAEHKCSLCARSFKKKAYLRSHMGKFQVGIT